MDDEKMTGEELLADEGALLRGLMQAGTDVANGANAATFQVTRNGAVLFAFKLRPMTEAEFRSCRDKATKFEMKRGIKVPVEFNEGRFRNLSIHKATLPIEGTMNKIWDHKPAQEQFNVASGVDLIDQVLLGGEKDRVYSLLEKISGYHTEDDGGTQAALEETAGE